MKLPKNLGMILLAEWLILFGILTAPVLKISSLTAATCWPCLPLPSLSCCCCNDESLRS